VAGGSDATGARVRSSRPIGTGQEPSSDSSRRRVLELLRQSPEGLGVTELAERSGLHPNTVRFHLNRLVTAGLARRDVGGGRPSRPGRPRLTFTATPEDLHGDRRNYQLLAGILAGYMADTAAPATQARQLGHAWGSYLATRPAPGQRVTEEQSVGELLRVLDDIGFSPQLAEDDGDGVIRLRHCPFLEVATAHREVVCSLHLGVMQGVLAEQRAPVEASDLQPFVEPSVCLAHVRRREPAQPPAS
jgi:predicted ArsR family transcriptional regulator